MFFGEGGDMGLDAGCEGLDWVGVCGSYDVVFSTRKICLNFEFGLLTTPRMIARLVGMQRT